MAISTFLDGMSPPCLAPRLANRTRSSLAVIAFVRMLWDIATVWIALVSIVLMPCNEYHAVVTICFAKCQKLSCFIAILVGMHILDYGGFWWRPMSFRILDATHRRPTICGDGAWESTGTWSPRMFCGNLYRHSWEAIRHWPTTIKENLLVVTWRVPSVSCKGWLYMFQGYVESPIVYYSQNAPRSCITDI
jgi:hypothetical protein